MICRRNLFSGLLVIGAIGVFVCGTACFRSKRAFSNPVAHAFSGASLYVLEKDRNTLLELAYSSERPDLEVVESHTIEPDDAEHYYMVRKLFPASHGIVAQSYIYKRENREFLGYRFSLYTSTRSPPVRLLTVMLKNPREYPEIIYASDGSGQHYFANNCQFHHNIWKIPRTGGVRVERDLVPSEVQVLGTINGPLDQWEGLAVGQDGSIFVSSAASGKICKYSPNGEELRTIGTVGFQEGELLAPGDLFFVRRDSGAPPVLTVASEGNRTWVQFEESGTLAGVIRPLHSGYPFEDILVGPFHTDPETGKWYGFDRANKSFVVFDGEYKVCGSYAISRPGGTVVLVLASVALLGLALAMPRIQKSLDHIRIPFCFKLLVFFIPLLMLTAEFVAEGVNEIMKIEMEREYVRRSANLAHAVLTSLALSDLQAIRTPQDREGPFYNRIYQTVSRLLDVKNVEQTPKWILYKIVGDRYYFGVNVWRGAIFEPYVVPRERRMFFMALQEKSPQHGQYIDEQGEWFSTLNPVLDEEGNVIYVLELYRSAEELDRGQREVSRSVRQAVGGTVAVTIVLVMIFSFVFTRPLRQLMRRTDLIRRGNFEPGIKIGSRDEMGDLGRAFDRMVADLKTYTLELARTTAEKESIECELRLARQLQHEMLPKSFPPFRHATHIAMYAEMEPAREVGGDYYDFFFVDDAHLGVVVADISGKGVPAGLFMMRVRALLRGSAVGNLSPADTLSRINQLIAPENPSGMFVTMFYFICHMDSGRITYCNSGHNPPLWLRNGETYSLGEGSDNGKGLPVGVFEEAEYSDACFQLNSDDVLVVYTDGVTEACNMNGELFGEERLVEVLAPLFRDAPEEICLQVLEEVRNHQGKARQSDDITILALRRLHPDAEVSGHANRHPG